MQSQSSHFIVNSYQHKKKGSSRKELIQIIKQLPKETRSIGWLQFIKAQLEEIIINKQDGAIHHGSILLGNH